MTIIITFPNCRPLTKAEAKRRAEAIRRSNAEVIDIEAMFAEAEAEFGIQPGDRVRHATFGYGAVVAVNGLRMTVDFDHAGRRLVHDDFLEFCSAYDEGGGDAA